MPSLILRLTIHLPQPPQSPPCKSIAVDESYGSFIQRICFYLKDISLKIALRVTKMENLCPQINRFNSVTSSLMAVKVGCVWMDVVEEIVS